MGNQEFVFDPGLLIDHVFDRGATRDYWGVAINRVRTGDDPEATFEQEYAEMKETYRKQFAEVPDEKREEMLDVLEADVSYNLATPFSHLDAAIHLFAKDDSVEVLIGHIPEPYMYHDNYNTDDREKLDQHAIAQWIIDDAASELGEWDYNTSSYKTRNPNYHLRDIYFECNRSEVNEAVLSAKRFLITLEEKVVKQKQRINHEFSNSPLQDLPE